MKNIHKNLWGGLSSSQKLNLIGAGLLIISLFLDWYSDKDIFRSGDSYSAMSGPLYLAGVTMLVLAGAHVLLTLAPTLRLPVLKHWSSKKSGGWQMAAGAATMYLLMLVNSVYFHPQFGLNILSKRSEIGVIVALSATVMMCLGGYLVWRKSAQGNSLAAAAVVKIDETPAPVSVPEITAREMIARNRVHQRVEVAPAVTEPQPMIAPENMPTVEVSATSPDAEKMDTVYKVEQDRSKLYENLRKTMLRDTMTPQQRKKERARENQINAFSANFGKGQKLPVSAPSGGASVGELQGARERVATVAAGQAATTAVKKPQMYRMDL